MAGIKICEVKGFDQLIGGTFPQALIKNITLAAGQGVLKRGTVLELDPQSGEASVIKPQEAGEETAQSKRALYILRDDTDTAEGAADAPAFMSGLFNREYLIFDGTDTPEDYEEELRDASIFLTSEKYHKEAAE